MNQVTPRPPSGPVVVSKVWDDVPRNNDDLKAGVSVSFPMLKLGQREWIVQWKGEKRVVPIPNTDYPAPFVDVVILNAQKDMSRVYYRDPYQQNITGKKPDCWSSNGIKPDASIAQPINSICATCPMSAWGSGGSPAAPKAQACQQRRRTVVVPYVQGGDLTNESEGGPMLLSVPPASLTPQVKYGEMLEEMERADGSKGVFYAAAVTRLSFESGMKFAKIQFEFVKMLDDDESIVVKNLRNTESVKRIMTAKMNDEEMEGPEVAPSTSQVQAPGIPPAPKAAAPVQPKVAPAPAAPKATPRVVGGHAVTGATGINEAVAKPAAPPASQRTVATAAPPVETPEIKHMAPAIMDDDEEAKIEVPGLDEGSVFDKLMNPD